MKDKAFARSVSRDDITHGAQELGIDLDEPHRLLYPRHASTCTRAWPGGGKHAQSSNDYIRESSSVAQGCEPDAERLSGSFAYGERAMEQMPQHVPHASGPCEPPSNPI